MKTLKDWAILKRKAEEQNTDKNRVLRKCQLVWILIFRSGNTFTRKTEADILFSHSKTKSTEEYKQDLQNSTVPLCFTHSKYYVFFNEWNIIYINFDFLYMVKINWCLRLFFGTRGSSPCSYLIAKFTKTYILYLTAE